MSDKELIENELERDLHLASLGDYPGAAGCKRMAAEITRLRSLVERLADMLDDAGSWLGISETVNHNKLCDKIDATVKEARTALQQGKER